MRGAENAARAAPDDGNSLVRQHLRSVPGSCGCGEACMQVRGVDGWRWQWCGDRAECHDYFKCAGTDPVVLHSPSTRKHSPSCRGQLHNVSPERVGSSGACVWSVQDEVWNVTAR